MNIIVRCLLVLQPHLPLLDSNHRYTAQLIHLFNWLSKDGSKPGQLIREELRSLLLAQRSVVPAAAKYLAMRDHCFVTPHYPCGYSFSFVQVLRGCW